LNDKLAIKYIELAIDKETVPIDKVDVIKFEI
jgi:hypothetical protein